MISTIRQAGRALRITVAGSGGGERSRELLAEPCGPYFRLVCVVRTAGRPLTSVLPDVRTATMDLDAAAVDALIVELQVWRAERRS
jgi:hypothetical protein